jgi:hypothetical protein
MGDAPIKLERNIGTVANMYPGRLVVREAGDYDIKVADGLLPPLGWLSYEDMNESERPATIDTINVLDTKGVVLAGGGFTVRGKLAAGFTAVQGDLLLSWTAGQVAVGAIINGRICIKVPFVQKSSAAFDTGIDIPGGVAIEECYIKVVTAVSSGTIDVGFINAVEGGDEDGLIDGESTGTAGFVPHNLVDVSAAAITLGAYLKESNLKDAVAVYYAVPKAGGYLTDGTITSLEYYTSAHASIGFIYVAISSPGVVPVGKAGAAADASSAAANIYVESDL